MSSPDVSVGYTLSTAGGANAAWSPKILDVQPPAETVEEIGTSDQAMTDTHMTFIPADIADPGSLTITHYFDAADPPVVGSSGAVEEWVLTYPDATSLTQDGFVQSHTPEDHTFNGAMMSVTVIRMSGDPVFA